MVNAIRTDEDIMTDMKQDVDAARDVKERVSDGVTAIVTGSAAGGRRGISRGTRKKIGAMIDAGEDEYGAHDESAKLLQLGSERLTHTDVKLMVRVAMWV